MPDPHVIGGEACGRKASAGETRTALERGDVAESGRTEATGGDPAALAPVVRRAQDGDMMAMHELLDIVTPYVRRLCGPIALQDAPDAVQETLIVMLRSLGQLREPAALFGWVRVIAV